MVALVPKEVSFMLAWWLRGSSETGSCETSLIGDCLTV